MNRILAGNTRAGADRAGLLEYSRAQYTEVKFYELDMLYRETALEAQEWQGKMDAVFYRAMIEWNKSERDFNAQWKNWRKRYREEFESKSQEWNEEYLEFVGNKADWVTEMTVKSTEIGSNLNTLNEDTLTQTRSAMESAVTNILISAEDDPDSIANQLMSNGLFAQLSAAGATLLDTVGENRFAFNTALKRTGFDTASTMKEFKDYQQIQNEEMKDRLAALQLEKMIDSFLVRIDNIALRVDETNDYWDNYTEDNLTASGFRRDGNYFVKDIVTDSTITSPVVRELRKIQEYQNMIYETPDLETASGIRSYGLAYDFDAIQALIANATQVVEAEEERVFGTGVQEWRSEGGAWSELEEAPDFSQESVREKGWQNRGDGLFGEYVGYAPIYKSGDNLDMTKRRSKNIRYKGSGELGRILGYLSWYNMEESAGYSKVNMPAWDKPLWDPIPFLGNYALMLEAPSFAGAVDMVVQVAATIATAPIGGWGGAALGAAIGSIDDLMFTALEVGQGYIIPEQAWLQVGQTLLKAGVQTLMTGVMNGFGADGALSDKADYLALAKDDTVTNVLNGMDPLEKFTLGGLKGVLGDNWMVQGALALGQSFGSNYANGVINAYQVELDENGEFAGYSFNDKVLEESMWGSGAVLGYIGSGISSLMNGLTLTDQHGNLLPDEVIGGGKQFNQFLGNTITGITETIMTGEMKFNVLNLKDIVGFFDPKNEHLDKMDMGLLEFGISGRGMRLTPGQGGFKISDFSQIGGIGDVLYGLQHKYMLENGNTTLDLVQQVADLGLEHKSYILDTMRRNHVEYLDDAQFFVNGRNGNIHVDKSLLEEGERGMLEMVSEIVGQTLGSSREEIFEHQLAFLDRYQYMVGDDYSEEREVIDRKIAEIRNFEASMEGVIREEMRNATGDDRGYYNLKNMGKSMTEIFHLLPEHRQIELFEELYDANVVQEEDEDEARLVKDQFRINLVDQQINLAFDKNILKASQFAYINEEDIHENDALMVEMPDGTKRHILIPYGYEHVTEEMFETHQKLIDSEIVWDDLRDSENLFSAELFIRDKDGELDVIIAYMGTTQDNPMDEGLMPVLFNERPDLYDMALTGLGIFDPKNKDFKGYEWIETNVQNQRGLLPEQYEMATRLAINVMENLTTNVILTGHSQGGGEARMASAATGFQSIVYNAAMVHPNNLDWAKEHGEREGINHLLMIRQYDVDYDPLNSTQDSAVGYYGTKLRI
jgi:hypothetical protein